MASTNTEASKLGSAHIQSMFAGIAGKYDFLNHFLSANRDKAWRRHAVELSQVSRGDKVLDICSGTGDLAFEYHKKECDVVGTDFCLPMLQLAQKKRPDNGPQFSVGDSLHLPVADNYFDVVSVAFGIRNVVDLEAGLREMNRVIRPGGKAIILELTSPPGPIFSRIYNFYFKWLLPLTANLFSKRSAYSYLNKSVAVFPNAAQLNTKMEEAGFVDCHFEYMTLGIVGLHIGIKK